MARVPYLTVEDLAPEHHWLLERPANIFRALANNPDAWRPFSTAGRWIRFEAPVDPRLREMAILQVGYVTACAYEFAHHVEIGKRFGVTEEDIDAIIRETAGEGSGLPALDVAVLAAARMLTTDTDLSDELWSTLEEGLGREHVIELVLVIGYYNHIVRVLRALRVELEDGYADVLDAYPPPAGATWR
jgi:alkylhydroperoxidase family enzyme